MSNNRIPAKDRIKTHMSRDNKALCNNWPSAYEPNRLTKDEAQVTCEKCNGMLSRRLKRGKR